ncbi:MAG: hypothetical protein F4X13_09220 [Gammaproteobacteria bacterium]|nr:hypothetical protein [Gammaproteobacteria bacterium]
MRALARSVLMLPPLFLGCGDGETAPGLTEPDPGLVPASMSITPESARLAAFGQSVQLTATVRDQGGQPLTGVAVNWASGNAGIVIVDAAGLVTAVDNGTTGVTATVAGGGASAAASVTVEQRVAELGLSSTREVMHALGDMVRMSAQAVDANGNPVTGAGIAWSSSDESVVTVDETGLVTAVGNGRAHVTVTAGSHSEVAEFTVEQLPTAIQVSPAADTLRGLGDTLRMSAAVYDANRHTVENAGFAWSSSDELVATVDARGLVTATGAGWVDIIARVSESEISGTVTLLVEVVPAREALKAFYNAAGGPNWKNSDNWLTDAPLRDWYGVRAGHRDGLPVVLELRLVENGLTGSIPPELGNLVNLVDLDLSNNDLTGPIPSELAALGNVLRLRLRRNSLTGSIPPELGNLAKLERLDLSLNDLAGSIPAELGDLTNLRALDLTWNELSGAIPPEIGQLTRLEDLDLALNDFSGPIPAFLGNLTNLRQLHLAVNQFSGQIPALLGGLTRLEHLGLNNNALSGPIPPELGNLTNLRSLSLSHNALNGTIPSEIGRMTNLEQAFIHNTEVTGPLPAELTRLRHLRVLRIDDNRLTGPLPAELAVLRNLSALYLNGNSFTGSIPPELGRLATLGDLRLSDNDLTGPIPPELTRLTNLRQLFVDNNSGLIGGIPQGFVDLELETFRWEGTQLCSPANEAFQTWLAGIQHQSGGAACAP